MQHSIFNSALKGNALEQWKQFASELATLDKVRIPRCYILHDVDPIHIQVHGFSDASEHAFAAVDGGIITRLIASKTRAMSVVAFKKLLKFGKDD